MAFCYTYSFGTGAENQIYSYFIFRSFDEVCDATDVEIRWYIEMIDEGEYIGPDREEMRQKMDKANTIEYYCHDEAMIYTIIKMRVQEPTK